MKLATFINKQLSMFSMYKGLLLGLLGILLVALGLSFMGWLAFTPLALLLSLGVFAVSVYGASWLCSKLFGASAHVDSSLITAVILTLIFTPTTDVRMLIIQAFVGLIAGASKYIVVWRGRHFLNPAALAAVVIAATGLGAASWWVATPVLAPIVAIVACVSLYQSKRFFVAGVFLAVAAPLLMTTLLLNGASLFGSFWLLLSWPLLFIAGVMLTEPLTLPPRHYQMVIVAVIVGVLVGIPMKLGPIAITPAVALLVGNIVAAFMADRSAVALRFKNRHQLTPTTDELVFDALRPVNFTPGQYMEIMLPHGLTDWRGSRRRFSVTSLPGEKTVSFGVKFYTPSSTFKKKLKIIPKGTELTVSQIAGDFVLPKNEAQPLLFVAGGIGVTPFIAQLRFLASKNQHRDIVLVYAVSSAGEVAYKDVLEASGCRVIVVTPEKATGLPAHWVNHIAKQLVVRDVAEYVTDIQERYAYVSGPVSFVQTMKHDLKESGAPHVKTDYFSGY